MEINNLSTNGFALSNVFDPVLLTDIVDRCNTFFRNQIRPSQPNGDNPREVCFIRDNTDLRHRILDSISFIIHTVTEKPRIRGMELWRDHPGYINPFHYDAPSVQNVMIIYLGDEELEIGTEYEEGVRFKIPYKKNTGLILLNSDKIFHGMVGSVPAGIIRKSLYINWINDKT
jgi:hypothetical protein